MMLVGFLAGLLAATGVLLAVTALAPQPTPLAERVRTALGTQPAPHPDGRWRQRAHRLGPVDDRLAADLEVTGRSLKSNRLSAAITAATLACSRLPDFSAKRTRDTDVCSTTSATLCTSK
ncbi:hypothetical protein FTX61_19745 [Nitriliruptoraceae bacterium ZYF776]|nr:hypothetical protein [Profundirhabdus halotolerans]